jgi:hypothetical protein
MTSTGSVNVRRCARAGGSAIRDRRSTQGLAAMAAFQNAVLLASLGCCALAAGERNSTLSLEKVIVVSRHGIRTP